jgi:hypothetical protein
MLHATCYLGLPEGAALGIRCNGTRWRVLEDARTGPVSVRGVVDHYGVVLRLGREYSLDTEAAEQARQRVKAGV